MEDSGSETTLVSDTDEFIESMFWTLDEDFTRDDLLRLINSSNPIDKEKLNTIFEEILEKDEEKIEFFEFLLSNGYKISPLNDSSMTIIHSAFYSDDYPILAMSQEYIPNLDDDMNYTDCNGLTHLHVASAQNNKEFVEKCLKSNKIDVNAIFHFDPSNKHSGFTALHFAVTSRGLSIVKLLLEHGANVNAKDHFGRTPLHLSCSLFEDLSGKLFGSYVDIMEILLKNNADIEAKDKKGNTPLLSIFTDDYNEFTFAIAFYFISSISFEERKLKLEFLLKAGADVTEQNSHGNTLLHLLVENLYFLRHSENGVCFHDAVIVDLIELILKLNNKIEINAKNHCGRTPLQVAVWFKSFDVVTALLQHNASLDNIELKIEDCHFFYYPNMFPNLEVVVGITGIIELFLDKGFKLTAHENLAVLKFLVHDVDNCECGTVRLGFSKSDVPPLRNLMNYGSPTHAQRIFETTMAKYSSVQSSVEHDIVLDLYIRNFGALYMNKQILNSVWQTVRSNLIKLPLEEIETEITRMKSVIVRDNVTLYNVMCKHPYLIYHYLQNINVQSFAEPFFWYKEIMKGHITQSLVRRYVENSAYLYLKESLFPSLPDVCCRLLLKYLRNEDILKACIAFTI